MLIFPIACVLGITRYCISFICLSYSSPRSAHVLKFYVSIPLTCLKVSQLHYLSKERGTTSDRTIPEYSPRLGSLNGHGGVFEHVEYFSSPDERNET